MWGNPCDEPHIGILKCATVYANNCKGEKLRDEMLDLDSAALECRICIRLIFSMFLLQRSLRRSEFLQLTLTTYISYKYRKFLSHWFWKMWPVRSWYKAFDGFNLRNNLDSMNRNKKPAMTRQTQPTFGLVAIKNMEYIYYPRKCLTLKPSMVKNLNRQSHVRVDMTEDWNCLENQKVT